MQKRKLLQVTYNWFCFRKGDSFSDFTIGQPAYRLDFPMFAQDGKVVKSMELIQEDSERAVKVEFEDGSITYQTNLNSWTYAEDISGSEAGTSDEEDRDAEGFQTR